MAVRSDRAQLGLPRSPGERVAGAYLNRFLVAAEHDDVVVKQFHRVSSLVDPPATLLRPRILWRVLAGNLRRAARDPRSPLAAPAVNSRG
ncbi:hypothetical protein AB0M54_07140 [Actinoplanes sp. NPDC051470]|uniref:hypothetical protein n=1 Tax=unclassified Actinoplanes TaxID=2626549 RepID=UPI00343501A9